MKNALLLLTVLFCITTYSQTYYRSSSSGNWNDPSRWEISSDGGLEWTENPGSYPTGANNTQTIIQLGHTMNLNGDYSIDQVIVEAGGILNIFDASTLGNGDGDDITVNGTMYFASHLSGSSNPTIQVNTGGVIEITSPLSSSCYLSGFTINNSGTINLLDNKGMVFSGNLVVNNLSDGLFYSNSTNGVNNVLWINSYATDGNQLNNAGTFQKTGSGITTVQIPLNNSGNINLEAGSMYMSSSIPSTSSGRFTLTDGTTISLVAATFTMEDGAEFTGTGNVALSATMSSTGTTNGLLFDNGINLNLTGILGGAGKITINGTLNWSSGNFEDEGIRNFAAGSTINLTGAASKYITNGIFTNYGTVNCLAGVLAFSNNAEFTNSETFNVLSVFSLSNSGGPYSKKFVNEGTMNIDPGSENTLTSLIKFENKGTVTISSGTFSQQHNDFYLTSGSIDNSAGTFSILSGATIHRTTGTFSNAFTFPANINVEYLGTTQVTTGFESPTTETVLQNLTINNSGGVILNSNVKVNSALYLTNGNLFLGNNDLNIAGSIEGTISAGNMIITNGSGLFKRTYNIFSSGQYTYPIGDNTGTAEYSPAVFRFLGSPGGIVGIKVTNSKHGSNSSGTSYLNRYWTITASGVADPQYDVYFYYTDADINGTESNLYGGKYDGSNWTLLAAVNTGNNSFYSGTQTSFSDFTAGELAGLPVELASFDASIKEGNVLLNWQTATEVNNYGFEVERKSFDADASSLGHYEFKKIGFVEGHGNSNSPKEYSFVDSQTLEVLPYLEGFDGTIQYRLKQIDTDGKFEYSNTITVETRRGESLPTKFSLEQNYPNPFNPTTTIKFVIPNEERNLTAQDSSPFGIRNDNAHVTLKVYDVLGNEVATLVNETKEPGIYEVEFNASQLASGIYFYRLRAGSFVQTKKLILIK